MIQFENLLGNVEKTISKIFLVCTYQEESGLVTQSGELVCNQTVYCTIRYKLLLAKSKRKLKSPSRLVTIFSILNWLAHFILNGTRDRSITFIQVRLHFALHQGAIVNVMESNYKTIFTKFSFCSKCFNSKCYKEKSEKSTSKHLAEKEWPDTIR